MEEKGSLEQLHNLFKPDSAQGTRTRLLESKYDMIQSFAPLLLRVPLSNSNSGYLGDLEA